MTSFWGIPFNRDLWKHVVGEIQVLTYVSNDSPSPPEIYLPSEMDVEPDLSLVWDVPWYHLVRYLYEPNLI